jgi:N-acyl-D-aspartate/D-glutamate deacylase
MFQKDMDELKDLLTKSSHIYPGLGDAGAHVSQIMDAGWSTFILSYWHRETGTFSIEQAVEKMTSGPAKVLGLNDRGVLSVGMKADVNVFDADEVCELQPTLVHDFPNGAPRFIQKSRGFKATIVNGAVSLRNGELTGTRAGEVLRHGQG